MEVQLRNIWELVSQDSFSVCKSPLQVADSYHRWGNRELSAVRNVTAGSESKAAPWNGFLEV